MGITHPPLSLGEMSRRIQVSAAASEKASEQEDILEHTTKSRMYQKYLCSACEKSLLSYQ